MKKISVKFLTVFLALVVMVMSLPMNVFAFELQNAINQMDSGNEEIAAEINESSGDEVQKQIVEITELRTENTKTFRLTDGSYYLAQYTTDIHTLDEEGTWQNIDNTLSESGSEISTKNAKIKFSKKTTGNERLFALHNGNRKLTLSLDGATKGVFGQIKNNEDVFPEDSTELQKMTTLSKISASVIYENILPNTDLEYVINGSNIKENIIVKATSDNYSYSFTMALNNLTAVLNSDGEIIISDVDTGEAIYTIPAPIMWDANGEFSDNVLASLTTHGNGKYTLTVTADSEWMNEEGRAFPVTIDPPIYTNQYYDICTCVSGITDRTAWPETLCVGVDQTVYWAPCNLPEIPQTAYINNAIVSFKGYLGNSVSTYPNGYIGAYEVKEAWGSIEGGWYGDDGELGSDYIDFQHVYAHLYQEDGREESYPVIVNNGEFSWNITSLVKKWYSNDSCAYGIALAPITDIDFKGTALFKSIYQNNGPVFMIQYIDMTGMENYWTFTEQNAGYAGIGAVNNANGNLVFRIPTLTTLDAIMPITPTLVYNSCITDDLSYQANMPIGYKWNFVETISSEELPDMYGTDDSFYVWTDEDMTKHYFWSTLTKGEYIDEDGMKLTLVNDSNTMILTDSDDNVKTFSKMGSEYNLTSLSDKYGNKLIFEYDSQFRPIKVKLKPNGVAEIVQLKIAYDENDMPCWIWNPHSKEAIIFRYSSSPSDYYSSPNGGEYLRQTEKICNVTESQCTEYYNEEIDSITIAAMACYEYDDYGMLNLTEDVGSGYILEYEYDEFEEGKVVSVSEFAWSSGNSYSEGQQIIFNYGTSSTTVITSGEDDKIYDENSDTVNDDLYTVYLFDNMGRTISCYTTNSERTQLYGAVGRQYVGSDNENAQNSIKTVAQLGLQASNLILNGGFEQTAENNQIPRWTTSGLVELSSLSYEGNYGAELSVNSNTRQSTISQEVGLDEGTYTISARLAAIDIPADVKIQIVVSSDELSENIVKTLSSNEFAASGEFTFDSMQIVVPEGDDVSYRIAFVLSSTTGSASDVSIDNIMLSRTTGAAAYDMMQNGGFERVDGWEVMAYDIGTGDKISYMNSKVSFITYDTNSEEDIEMGYCVEIDPAIGEIPIVEQVVYEAPQSLEDSYRSPNFHHTPSVYTLSGWAKGSVQSFSNESAFDIVANVEYTKHIPGTEVYMEYSKDYVIAFDRGMTNWQFGITVIADDLSNGLITKITIKLRYINHPGVGRFNDISLIKDSADTAVYDYDYKGYPKSVQTGNYKVWFERDSQNRVIREMTSDGKLTEYTYNGVNIVKEKIKHYDGELPLSVGGDLIWNDLLPDNISFVYSCDYGYTPYGKKSYTIVTATEAGDSGIILESNYNDTAGSPIFGVVSETIDERGYSTQYFYDNGGRLVAAVYADNTATVYNYDTEGKLTRVTPGTYSASTGYAGLTGAESVEYVYDDSTKMLTNIVTESTTYTFGADEFGNTTSVTAGNYGLVSYTYNDFNGKLSTLTYGNGLNVKYVYDMLDRISEIQYNIGTDEAFETVYEYTYDSAGNLYSITDKVLDQTTMYCYDNAGKLVQSYVYDNSTMYNLYGVNVMYDGQSRVSVVRTGYDYSVSGSYSNDAIVYSYGYNDATGTLSSMNFSSTGVIGTVTPRYDSLGRMTGKGIAYTSSTMTEVELFRNNIDITYYEDDGLLSYFVSQYESDVELGNGQTQTTTYNYIYDSNGYITEVRNGNNAIQYKYYYDDLGQLTREDNIAKNKTYTYAYDDAGNITSKKTYAFTTGDLGTASSTVNYTYGDATWGDLLTKYGTTNITYDEIGNPTKIGYYDLTWQGRELQSWSDDECTTVYYGYNSDGIRTYKEILDDDTGCGTRHEYVLDGGTILYEIVYSITPTSKTESYIIVYLYDENGSPVGMKYRTPSYGDSQFDTYFFEKNLQGDIIAVYSGAGTKLCTFKYDAWGYSTISYESGVASSTKWFLRDHCVFRYRGYYYDSETGYYYLQSRYYNPQWGRFLNADGYINGNGDIIGYNMFAYCSNNPVMFVDPTGEILISTLIIGGIVGLAIGVTTSIVSQGFTKGWENINAQQVVFDGVLGAVSGVIGASGIGVVGSMIWGGTLNFAGSIGSDLIANDGNWEDVNWGKAFAMAAIGVGFGRWAGAGAQNTKAMCQAINEGKSWGAKIFNSFSGNVSSRATSQLSRQTSALFMSNSILGYKVQAISMAAASIIGSSIFSTIYPS